jgi:hypothetical protein
VRKNKCAENAISRPVRGGGLATMIADPKESESMEKDDCRPAPKSSHDA